MRFFAEEKQSGTWELLLTKPLTGWQIVLGKYFAGLVLVLLALLPTLIYYASVSYLAQPAGNVDSGQFWGSFIGLFFLAAVYAAIGTFSSSLSNNQITAFITAWCCVSFSITDLMYCPVFSAAEFNVNLSKILAFMHITNPSAAE